MKEETTRVLFRDRKGEESIEWSREKKGGLCFLKFSPHIDSRVVECQNLLDHCNLLMKEKSVQWKRLSFDIFSWNVAVQCQSCLTVIFLCFGRFEGCRYLIQWKVMTLIRWGSNFHFFLALYCSCLGLNAQTALPTKERGNSKGRNKVLQRKQNYCGYKYVADIIVTSNESIALNG